MSKRRRAAVLTTGRQDYGILRSTLLLLRADPDFELLLFAGGMHLSHRYGLTIREIEEDGFSCAEEIDWLDGEQEASVAAQMSLAVLKLTEALRRWEPEFMMLVGDRYEVAAAALAATVERIPIVHVHGGEETEGAFDNQLRHAITKMSHLHLVSAPRHATRVIQMGEEPSTVHVVGAPGLDNFSRNDLPSRSELEQILHTQLTPPVVLVTLHPTTLADSHSGEADAVIGAMRAVDVTYVVTLPNSDPGNLDIRLLLLALRSSQQDVTHSGRITITEALGSRFYFGLMRVADALLGNSSSAIIEAPAFGIPAVNVGDRQKGRTREDNVIDVAGNKEEIANALRLALSAGFREEANESKICCGLGNSGRAIVQILRDWQPPNPPRKSFFALNAQVEWQKVSS